jgi:hypothetical protein
MSHVIRIPPQHAAAVVIWLISCWWGGMMSRRVPEEVGHLYKTTQNIIIRYNNTVVSHLVWVSPRKFRNIRKIVWTLHSIPSHFPPPKKAALKKACYSEKSKSYSKFPSCVVSTALWNIVLKTGHGRFISHHPKPNILSFLVWRCLTSVFYTALLNKKIINKIYYYRQF